MGKYRLTTRKTWKELLSSLKKMEKERSSRLAYRLSPNFGRPIHEKDRASKEILWNGNKNWNVDIKQDPDYLHRKNNRYIIIRVYKNYLNERNTK